MRTRATDKDDRELGRSFSLPASGSAVGSLVWLRTPHRPIREPILHRVIVPVISINPHPYTLPAISCDLFGSLEVLQRPEAGIAVRTGRVIGTGRSGANERPESERRSKQH